MLSPSLLCGVRWDGRETPAGDGRWNLTFRITEWSKDLEKKEILYICTGSIGSWTVIHIWNWPSSSVSQLSRSELQGRIAPRFSKSANSVAYLINEVYSESTVKALQIEDLLDIQLSNIDIDTHAKLNRVIISQNRRLRKI